MQKNYIVSLSIGLIFCLGLALPNISQAVSVPIGYNPNRTMSTAACGPVPVALVWAVPILTDTCIISNVNTYVSLSKSFQLSKGGALLPQWGATVNVGNALIGGSPAAINTVGSFAMAGSGYGTPPLDNTTVANQWIPFTHNSGYWTTGANFQFWGGLADASTYTLSSSNPAAISCSGTNCTAVGPGTANITANFSSNGSYYYVYQNASYVPPSGSLNAALAWNWLVSPWRLEWTPFCNGVPALNWTAGWPGNAYAVGVLFTCGFPGVTMPANIVVENFTPTAVTYYNVTSIMPNQAPVVAYTGTTGMGQTTATANWSYNDADGDAQVWSHVQIATDPGFSNIIADPYQNSGATNMAISGLIPGTTYYPRVRVYNAVNGWTGYVYGPAFQTLPNQAPIVTYTGTTDIGYTNATANWSYSDAEGDAQVWFNVQIATDPGFSNIIADPYQNSGATNQAISGLVPGTTYYPRVRVYNVVNGWTSYVNGPAFQALPYPAPGVVFNLNGGGNTVSSGETLIVNTGEEINVNWDITNTDGVEVSTCRMTTSGGPQQIFNINPLGSLKGGESNTPAANLNDQTYAVRLECAGKTPANPVRNIDRTINVFIRSRPIASCTVQNSIVTSSNPIAKVNVNVTNAIPNYTWQVNKGGGGYESAGSTSNANLVLDINYSGTTVLNKYQPSVRVTDGNGRSDDAFCNLKITNLGKRFIREISP